MKEALVTIELLAQLLSPNDSWTLETPDGTLIGNGTMTLTEARMQLYGEYPKFGTNIFIQQNKEG